jgi:dehydrogenase/reductase SDR family member 12
MSWWNSLLDKSIVASFDASGFRRHAAAFNVPTWTRQQRVLITGGTAGIGLAHAQALANLDARLTLWGRDAARGNHAAADLPAVFHAVDVGDLAAVQAAAWALPSEPFDGVTLNAGAMPLQRTVTPQGRELVWSSQVLGHLLLLRILRERGLLAKHARVVWVSSGGMYTQRLDVTDVDAHQGYDRHVVYAKAKRAQVVLSEQLASLWQDVDMACMHPGWVQTDAVKLSMPLFERIMRHRLRTPSEGADTITWLIADQARWLSGRFWFDRTAQPTHMRTATQETEAERQQLWSLCLQQTERWLSKPS